MTIATFEPRATAAGLADIIRAHADAGEQERRLSRPVVEALTEAGIFRLLTPRAFGGLEVDPATACRAVEELSRIDGSTGWCAMLGACLSHFGGLLPEEAAHEIYDDPRTVVAGTFRPNGIARLTDDGYRVTGRWPLASGIPHATWVVGGCRVFDGEQLVLTPNGTPDLRLLFFPPADVEVIDTWHVAGLRGTGSNDFVMADVFVPARRAVWFSQPPVQPGPLYGLPAIALFAALIGCVSLGIARHALDAFANLAGAKTPTGSQVLLREKAMAQAQLGEAEGLLRAGRAFLYETVSAAWETALCGKRLSWEQRGLLWLAATQAALQASQAVDLMFRAGGASSVYATTPLERCLRDIRTAAQHVCVTPTNYEFAGRLYLEMDLFGTPWSMDYRGDA